MGERGGVFRVLVRKPEGKRPLGRPRRRWENSIKMDLRKWDVHCSSNIVRVIKTRRMRWAEHVARMGERGGVYSVLVGKPEGKRQLG